MIICNVLLEMLTVRNIELSDSINGGIIAGKLSESSGGKSAYSNCKMCNFGHVHSEARFGEAEVNGEITIGVCHLQ